MTGDFTPGFRAIINDAIAAGLEVEEGDSAALIVVKRHARTERILRGMTLYGSGTAIDASITLGVAKGIRKLSDIREHLGLAEKDDNQMVDATDEEIAEAREMYVTPHHSTYLIDDGAKRVIRNGSVYVQGWRWLNDEDAEEQS